MIFHPRDTVNTSGKFDLPREAYATAHPCLNKNIIKEFWHNFTFGSSTLSIRDGKELIFKVGDASALPLDGCDYSINVDNSGICILAKDEKSLVQGYMTLLDRFYATDGDDGLLTVIDCCKIKDKPAVTNRMVHFCVFPETELWELQRFIRFCGALKYTHIVLEFWGMLRYDCLKELSWENAFTKEQIKPLIMEANDLGLEIIPMFNQWGHASAGRVMHGKHVVLDQNPALQTYFSEDGWCWDIRKPKVKALLRQIRKELTDLCGRGSYFHIGCDEAYNFKFTKENMDMISGFINEVSDEMSQQDRRVIVWGDMFLYRHPHYNSRNSYTCNCPTKEAEEYMLKSLSRKVVVADWQYDAREKPVETVSTFTKEGLDCLLCPWDRGDAMTNASLSTVREQSLMGFMHTTWHTLSRGMPYVLITAVVGFDGVEIWGITAMCTHTASLLRKVMIVKGDYRKAGWSKFQVDSLW